MSIFSQPDEHFEGVKEAYRDAKFKIEEAKESVCRRIAELGTAHAPKFEHLVVDNLTAEEVNLQGLLGWELVGLTSYTVGFGLGGNERMKVHVRYAFKRPLAASSQELTDEVEYLRKLFEWKASLVAQIEERGFKAE